MFQIPISNYHFCIIWTNASTTTTTKTFQNSSSFLKWRDSWCWCVCSTKMTSIHPSFYYTHTHMTYDITSDDNHSFSLRFIFHSFLLHFENEIKTMSNAIMMMSTKKKTKGNCYSKVLFSSLFLIHQFFCYLHFFSDPIMLACLMNVWKIKR